jgi:iron complex outermembrane receptor protein
MKQSLITGVGAAVAASLCMLPSSNMHAQQATASEGLAEVVVTARKRTETLIEVPISVQAFSEEELKASGVTDLKSLQAVAGFLFPPMVGTAAAGRTFGALTFRGLAPDTGGTFENSGSVFIDGVFISGGLGSINTSDVERVEVLKGPQNTFFGRSTFGGAINFITRNPSKDFHAALEGSLTEKGSNSASLSLEGPLAGDWLTGRVMLLSTQKRGQYTASDGGRLGDEATKSVTATLYAKPTDGSFLRFRGQFQSDDDGPAALGYIPGNTSCNGLTFPGQTGAGIPTTFKLTFPYICGTVPRVGTAGTKVDANTALPAIIFPALANALGDPLLSSAPTISHSGMRRDILRLAFSAGTELPHGLDLEFNVGFNRAYSVSVWDLDRWPVQNFLNIQPLLARDMTADLRLSTDRNARLRGLIGASYFHGTYQISQVDWNAAFGAPAFTLGTNFQDNHSFVPAVYGSLDFDILSNLTASAELRYQKDRVDDYTKFNLAKFTNETTKLLPRVILSYKPVKDTNIYASWAKGVQPLTLNSGYINALPVARTFLQQLFPGLSEYSLAAELDSRELGLKQRLFDGRFEYSLSFYDSKWKNRPTNAFVFNPDSCVGQPVNTVACPLPIAGLGTVVPNDAKIRGVEFSSNALLTDKWSAALSVNYTHARWSSYFNSNFRTWTTNATAGGAPIFRFDGNTIARQPDVTAVVSSTYRNHLTGDWSWYVRGDVRYMGKMYAEDLNILQSDPYTRVYAHLGVEQDNVGIELYVNNLTNDDHWDYIFRLADLRLSPLSNFSSQGVGAGAPDRREFGIKASYKF